MAEVERWLVPPPGRRRGRSTDLYCTDASPDGDFDDVDPTPTPRPTSPPTGPRSRPPARAVAEPPLDDTFVHAGDGTEQTSSLRWIYVHMIEEYARHNGHADLIRERIDGVTGD